MKMLLASIFLLPCESPVVQREAVNVTIVHACPKTARYIWEEYPEGPQDFARQMHYWALPRDDRPPLKTEADETVAKVVKKPVKVSKKSKKIKKRKKRKRK